jgi:hypothetical protein
VIRLTRSLAAWGSPEFASVLKEELAALGTEQLPLQQGLATTSYALDGNLSARIIRVGDDDGHIQVRAGLFYSDVISGCSCADDPTPIDEQNEYCEVQLVIDKLTAETRIELLTS